MLTKRDAARRIFGDKDGYSREEWSTADRAVWLAAREEELRKEEYQRYLRSPQWRKRWAAVMERDQHKCRFCGRKAKHVHHLTYARIFNEQQYDLVAVCEECHALLHKLDGNGH